MRERKQIRERRHWQRLPLALPLFVRGSRRGKKFMELTTAVNISAGGVLLATRFSLPRSSEISIEVPATPVLKLAFQPRHVRKMQARVVRVTRSEEYSLYAFRFARPLV